MVQDVESHPIESATENRDFFHVIQQALSIRRHIEIFLWLNGELQRFLPHEVLVMAWGDFSVGHLNFDVISAIPGVRTNFFRGGELMPVARRFFNAWVSRGSSPLTLDSELGFFESESDLRSPLKLLKSMRVAVVHGLHDARSNTTHLYFCLSAMKWHHPARVRASIEFLLPHLDVALRRLAPIVSDSVTTVPVNRLSEVVKPAATFAIPDLGLSARECEVMSWVRMGKTNQEIGQILNISTYTVKNHLQRVFKKLDVLNRAQAVASMSDDKHRSSAT